jgi:hypothetical protein
MCHERPGLAVLFRTKISGVDPPLTAVFAAHTSEAFPALSDPPVEGAQQVPSLPDPSNCFCFPAQFQIRSQLAYGGPGNSQLGTDLTQTPTPRVQVGCTLNVHGATVTSLSRSLTARSVQPAGPRHRTAAIFRTRHGRQPVGAASSGVSAGSGVDTGSPPTKNVSLTSRSAPDEMCTLFVPLV